MAYSISLYAEVKYNSYVFQTNLHNYGSPHPPCCPDFSFQFIFLTISLLLYLKVDVYKNKNFIFTMTKLNKHIFIFMVA